MATDLDHRTRHRSPTLSVRSTYLSRLPSITDLRGAARWAWALAREVFDEYRKDDVGDLAAATTFWTIASIPAAALALVSTLSSLDSLIGASLAADVEDTVRSFVVDTFADSSTLDQAVTDLFESPSGGLATLAFLVALFTLSRAFAGLIRALDAAYDVEESRPFWLIRLVAVGYGLATILVIGAAAGFLAALPSIPLPGAGRVLSGLLTVGVVVAWITTLFHLAPNHETPWRYDLPGGLFAAIGWIVATQAYALYVRVAVGTGQVQGSVGAVLLALTLLYVLSVILLLGAELNDVLARRAGVVQVPRQRVRAATRQFGELARQRWRGRG